MGPRTRIVALTHVSNALGTILPVREMIQSAHRWGARVLIDGAQAVSHFPVNVQELDADFYVFSGHKMFGPSGVGVLYGKKALLDEMPPWQGGGNMIQRVTFENSTFADPPARFEAGTAALGPAVGLGAAVDYLERIGMENVARHERELLAYATEALSRIPGVRLIGTAPEKAGVVSFITDDITLEEMGSILDQDGIAVRAGHHCAQPTMDRFGLTAPCGPRSRCTTPTTKSTSWSAPSAAHCGNSSRAVADFRRAMQSTSIVAPLFGGILIGSAASGLLLLNGRIAGISNIAAGLLPPWDADARWRFAFFLGLLTGGVLLAFAYPGAFSPPPRSLPVLAIAGLLVGLGTRIGRGCTSGHGVCGLARRSARSLAATVTFMAAGVITVYLFDHLLRNAWR